MKRPVFLLKGIWNVLHFLSDPQEGPFVYPACCLAHILSWSAREPLEDSWVTEQALQAVALARARWPLSSETSVLSLKGG